MRKIQVGNSKVYIPKIINGLTSEAAEINKAYNKIKPDVVAMQISEAELDGLKRITEGEEFDYFMSNYEQIYAKKLAAFGEVKVPPPCYESAMKLCLRDEVPVEPIDMDDIYYADVFCENVSTRDLIRHSLRVKKLRRKKFKVETAEEFVLAWDKEINKLKGFRNLETAREKYMGRELVRLSKKYSRILCIMELQRAEGVIAHLMEKD
jgi:hypothetical protein